MKLFYNFYFNVKSIKVFVILRIFSNSQSIF